MDAIVACRMCGALVLVRLQSQHTAYHQHPGPLMTVDYVPVKVE